MRTRSGAAGRSKVVAIGETGLDYYYDNSPRSAQRVNFETHIKAAQQSGLPIIVHTRDAEADTLELLADGLKAASFGCRRNADTPGSQGQVMMQLRRPGCFRAACSPP